MTNALRSSAVSRSRRVTRFVTRAALTTALVAAAAAIGMWVSPGGRTVEAVGEAFGSGGEYHALDPDAHPRHPYGIARRAAGRSQGLHHAGLGLHVRGARRGQGWPARVHRCERRRLRRQRARGRRQHHGRAADARRLAACMGHRRHRGRELPRQLRARPGRPELGRAAARAQRHAHRPALHPDRPRRGRRHRSTSSAGSRPAATSPTAARTARASSPPPPDPAASSTPAPRTPRSVPASSARSRSGEPTPPIRPSPTSSPTARTWSA